MDYETLLFVLQMSYFFKGLNLHTRIYLHYWLHLLPWPRLWSKQCQLTCSVKSLLLLAGGGPEWSAGGSLACGKGVYKRGGLVS